MSKGELSVSKPMDVQALAGGVNGLLALWHADFDVTGPDALRALRDGAVAALKSGEAAKFAHELVRPASDRELAILLADNLLSAWPQDKKNDLRIFSRLLAEDVSGLQASPMAIVAACKAVRAASTFLPTIAEVMAAVGAQKDACAARAALLARLPRRVVEASRQLGENPGP